MVGDQNLSQKLEHQLEQGLGQGGGEESKWQWSLSRSRPRCLGCPCKWPKKHHWEDKAMEKVFTLELFSGKICVCRWGGGRGWVLTDNNRYFLNCPSRRGGQFRCQQGSCFADWRSDICNQGWRLKLATVLLSPSPTPGLGTLQTNAQRTSVGGDYQLDRWSNHSRLVQPRVWIVVVRPDPRSSVSLTWSNKGQCTSNN